MRRSGWLNKMRVQPSWTGNSALRLRKLEPRLSGKGKETYYSVKRDLLH